MFVKYFIVFMCKVSNTLFSEYKKIKKQLNFNTIKGFPPDFPASLQETSITNFFYMWIVISLSAHCHCLKVILVKCVVPSKKDIVNAVINKENIKPY